LLRIADKFTQHNFQDVSTCTWSLGIRKLQGTHLQGHFS
jgi:hypothetical protein